MIDLAKQRAALIAEVAEFKKDCMELWFVPDLADSYKNSSLFEFSILDEEVFFLKEQTRQLWTFWNKAKAQAVPESFEIGRLKDRITELLDERQDLYAQINSAQDVPNNHVVIPKECPDPIFADSLFNYLRSKSYTEEKGFEYIYLSDIDETEVWNFAVNASESGAEG